MLIRCERHTEADLKLWAELEAADLAHYRSANVGLKAERAKSAIREFAAAGPCYCSVSWGKDSTVLAHLTDCADLPSLPFAWVTVGELDVGCDRVRDHFLSMWPRAYREVAVDPGERTHQGTEGKRIGFLALEDEFGPRRLVGIRADESGGRAISIRHLGVASPNSCRPLAHWTEADVFAYLAFHGLPVHQNYAMLGGGRWSRDHLRTAPLGGKRGDQFGRAEWEREYYGDVLRRLECGG